MEKDRWGESGEKKEDREVPGILSTRGNSDVANPIPTPAGLPSSTENSKYFQFSGEEVIGDDGCGEEEGVTWLHCGRRRA